jgi:pimeloyl-ACP methyl ester carboxylesterase
VGILLALGARKNALTSVHAQLREMGSFCFHTPGRAPLKLEHHYAKVGGARLHYVAAGSGPPVVLLHGFPETHRSWGAQLPALAAKYRVVAPDLRGYGASDRPRSGYDVDTLADDVAALIRHLDAGPVSLVGHDWGGTLAWHATARHPGLVSRLVVIDGPHLAVMLDALRTNRRQLRRSWYMFFFQLPVLPELWLSQRRGRNIGRMWRDGPKAERAPRALIGAERDALRGFGGLRGPLAYYRSAARRNLTRLASGAFERPPPVRTPVTLIWGAEDSCLGVELVDRHRPFAHTLRTHVLASGGHFVHQELPDEVNAILLDALSGA